MVVVEKTLAPGFSTLGTESLVSGNGTLTPVIEIIFDCDLLAGSNVGSLQPAIVFTLCPGRGDVSLTIVFNGFDIRTNALRA